MSSPADQLDAALKPSTPPVAPTTPAPTPSAPTQPQNLSNAYMAHSDTMRGAAASEQLDAMVKGQQQDTGPDMSMKPGQPDKESSQTMSGLVTGESKTSSLQKAGSVANDIGMGVLQAPRAIVKGVRDAYQSMLDLTKEVGDFTNKFLPALQLTGAGAPRIVSAAERAADPSLPGSLADKINLPDIAAPSSTTGVIEKSVVQFITGLSVAGGQLKALGVPAASSGLGAASLTALKGFVGQFEAFDGSQQNLSNLIQSVPALKNPVTQFLATNQSDSDATNRLKSALEGTIGGQLVDGLVGGLRFLRSANAAKSAAENAAGAMEGHMDLGEDIGPPSKGMTQLGEAAAKDNAPLVSAKFNMQTVKLADQQKATEGMTPDQVARMGEPGIGKNGVYVNFARINGPDDIKNAMGQLADAFKENINDARRGVQTFEMTKLGADAVDAWSTLMARRVGEPLNAEESLAARQLWATSASKTYDLANTATAEPTPENLFAFRKMLATHAAIQEQVIAARTETARALSSWRIPAGAQDYRMAQMMQSLKQDTGPASDGLSVSLDLAQRVKAMQQAMDVNGLNNFSEKGVYATTRDAALEAWTNGLLTSPLTHVKVFVSNAATTALRIAERGIAGKVDSVLGDSGGVAVGEAGASYSGLVSGLKDAFRYAGRAANSFLTREPLPPLGDDPLSNAIKAAKSGSYSKGEDVPDQRFGGAISSQAFGIAEGGWVGQGVDLLGQIVRAPGRALTAEHDFFRSIGYRMELNALATRQATAEVTAGKITEDALGSRVAEIVANPPPSVSIGAIDGMKYQTFTDAPGKLANLIEQARTDFPLLRVVLPFYKIPSRILSFTFERSPIAPLMQAYQSNISAGGARASLARAQMGLGTGIMLATADAVLSGQVTGSGPPEKSQRAAMMNTGWLPYSMKVGDRWVQYSHLETVGSSMAMAADIVETMHNYNQALNGDDPDMSKLAVAATLSVAQDVTSKTYLQGLSNFFEMLANPKTEGESQLRSLAGSAVPAGAAAIDRLQDPYQRSVYSMIDAIKARTPGASESLPPRRDVWGDPIQHASGMGGAYDLLSPFATRQPTDSPIDKEIVRLGANVNLPSSKVSFGQGASVDLHKDPQLYSRYVQLAGNGYKDPAWGMGAKDLLNQIVTGQSPLSPIYNMKSDGPDGQKAEMIKGIMNQYREGAKQQLLEENPKLQPIIDQKRASAQALKMPVTQ